MVRDAAASPARYTAGPRAAAAGRKIYSLASCERVNCANLYDSAFGDD